MATERASLRNLITSSQRDVIIGWLHADCPGFDVGGFVVGDQAVTFQLFCKQPCIISGLAFADVIFDHLGVEIEWHVSEGSVITLDGANTKIVVGTAHGPCNKLLLAERTVLNIISRASGVATQAAQMVSVAASVDWKGQVAGTRKTTPGFGFVEKYSLLVAGAATHRMDLSQMTMLKDNHIASHGSITEAVRVAKRAGGFSIKVEVECSSIDEALEACGAGADIVMLDNFSSTDLKDAAHAVKLAFPNIIIEASGGITKDTIVNFMFPSVDIISMGSLTHGYDVIDFSFKFQKNAM